MIKLIPAPNKIIYGEGFFSAENPVTENIVPDFLLREIQIARNTIKSSFSNQILNRRTTFYIHNYVNN